jgi:hypothetical protein
VGLKETSVMIAGGDVLRVNAGEKFGSKEDKFVGNVLNYVIVMYSILFLL